MIMPKDEMPDAPEDEGFQIYLDALNATLAKESDRRNSTPDPEMGGLSPAQVDNLIYSSWGEKGSLVQFDNQLALEILNTSTFFRQARLLLQAVVDAGGVKATSGKNLNRKFVEDLTRRIASKPEQKRLFEYYKKLNEQDARDIHMARIVCQEAKMLRLHRGAFVVSKPKQIFLDEMHAGMLFRFLFVAYYRQFNIAYLYRYGPDAESVQQCIGYSLFRVGALAGDWIPVKGLASLILLPAVIRHVKTQIGDNSFFKLDDVLEMHVLRPLLDWGFLEATRKPSPVAYLEGNPKAVRVTPLYRAFFKFGINP